MRHARAGGRPPALVRGATAPPIVLRSTALLLPSGPPMPARLVGVAGDVHQEPAGTHAVEKRDLKRHVVREAQRVTDLRVPPGTKHTSAHHLRCA
jgi:hypothetical protein